MEQGPPGVHHKSLHARGLTVRDHFFVEQTLVDDGHIVVVGPSFGLVLEPEVDVPGFKRKPDRRRIPEVCGTDDVKVVHPAPNRQIRAPVIRHPFLHDVAAGFKLLNPVGATAQWGV